MDAAGHLPGRTISPGRYLHHHPMSLSFQFVNRHSLGRHSATRRAWLFASAIAVSTLGCTVDVQVTPPGGTGVAVITVDSGPRTLERGTRVTLKATARSLTGGTVETPFVWRSSDTTIAAFGLGGALVARDTGITVVTASALGVVSSPIAIRVVWLGPSRLTRGPWAPPHAVTPGVALTDSLRVLVTNPAGAAVANAKVSFVVTSGGGTISPSTVTTGPSGIATARWTLGPTPGKNAAAVSVVGDDGLPLSQVTGNPATFDVTSYNALSIIDGADQSGLLLTRLPVAPAVKLVDSLGQPRVGVPILFVPTNGGRVVFPVVSTGADGVASPGAWTLGETPGEQFLEARVEEARLSLRATATGTPTYFFPSGLALGGFSSCAINTDRTVSCWGVASGLGGGDSVDVSKPVPTKGGLVVRSLAGSPTHYCGLAAGDAVWCWGINALVDTSGRFASSVEPTKLPSDLRWAQVSPGFAHNCGVTVEQLAYCWGDNANGQLGDRTTTRHFAPTAVAGGFKFMTIASGTSHTCGLTPEGAAFCWGLNQFGQLGDGTTQTRISPTAVGGGFAFQKISVGETLSCALDAAGKVYCWGGPTGAALTTPTSYPGAPNFSSFTVGGGHACGLTSDGTAYCWGSNSSGQLGDSSTTSRPAPTLVAGGLRFQELSAGYFHTCGRTSTGEVACWGLNRFGETGDGNTNTVRITPRLLILGVKE
jgi:alpha-tubulin suppressor-like RCC1 family protein